MPCVPQFKVRTKISNPSNLSYPYPCNGGPESKCVLTMENNWKKSSPLPNLLDPPCLPVGPICNQLRLCLSVRMSVRVRHKFSYLPLP